MRRPDISSSLTKPCLFLPQMITSPLSGASSPAITFKIVDLPVPEGPIIPTASPCLILKLTPLNTCLSPNDL
uniref:Uncharacterized protein n=1 Tax=Arundo donax TaxID=35708 RepID=A0A0A9DDT4_ARUDO